MSSIEFQFAQLAPAQLLADELLHPSEYNGIDLLCKRLGVDNSKNQMPHTSSMQRVSSSGIGFQSVQRGCYGMFPVKMVSAPLSEA